MWESGKRGFIAFSTFPTAILDGLLHHSTTLNIKGESYRLKEKRKAGLLGRTPALTAIDAPEEA